MNQTTSSVSQAEFLDLSTAELIGLSDHRYSMMVQLFTIHLAVVAALISLLSGPGSLKAPLFVIITLGFSLFSISNYRELERLRVEKESIAQLLLHKAEADISRNKFPTLLNINTAFQLKFYYASLFMLMIGALVWDAGWIENLIK